MRRYWSLKSESAFWGAIFFATNAMTFNNPERLLTLKKKRSGGYEATLTILWISLMLGPTAITNISTPSFFRASAVGIVRLRSQFGLPSVMRKTTLFAAARLPIKKMSIFSNCAYSSHEPGQGSEQIYIHITIFRMKIEYNFSSTGSTISHFRITFGLFFKVSPGDHLFIWKLVCICMWMKANFHMKGRAQGLALEKRVIWKWSICLL